MTSLPGRTSPRHLPWVSARRRMGAIVLTLSLLGAASGCREWRWQDWSEPTVDPALRTQALGYLRQAIAYTQSATIRCQAIEALAEEAPKGAEGWFIEALGDANPAVRFAACVALGRIRHRPAKPMLDQRLGDENHSVRAAAIFALHRLGDYTHSGEMAEMLLHHKSEEVRGNTAMLFGLLGEPGAVKLLKRVQKDSAYMVVWQALESRLILKDPEALPRVATQAHSGREDIRVLALIALGRAGNQRSAEVLRYRLNREEDHLESRLAAARGLGLLGHDDGLTLARSGLAFDSPNSDPRAGLPEDQKMRIRSLAALALGAMRAESALPDLKALMVDSQDARIQVAAARAILQIVPDKGWAGPGKPTGMRVDPGRAVSRSARGRAAVRKP